MTTITLFVPIPCEAPTRRTEYLLYDGGSDYGTGETGGTALAIGSDGTHSGHDWRDTAVRVVVYPKMEAMLPDLNLIRELGRRIVP